MGCAGSAQKYGGQGERDQLCLDPFIHSCVGCPHLVTDVFLFLFQLMYWSAVWLAVHGDAEDREICCLDPWAHSYTGHTGQRRRATQSKYCKSTNFGMLLYLANLANCVFSLIFVAPTYVNYVDRTLQRWGDVKFNSRQISLF